MKRTLTTLALLAAGFVAGQVVPVHAADGADAIVRELREIRGELANIRRAVEKGARQ